MGSDEERLEEMLKAVLKEENEKTSVQSIKNIQKEEVSIPETAADSLSELSMDDLPELPMDDFSEMPMDDLLNTSMDDLPELPMDDFPELPMDDLSDMLEDGFSDIMSDEVPEVSLDDLSDDLLEKSVDLEEEIPEELTADGVSEQQTEEATESHEDRMTVNPLDFLSMSEEEIDKVLEEEASLGEKISGKKEADQFSDRSNVNDDLADIRQLLDMSDNHEQVEDIEKTEFPVSGSTGSGGEEVQKMPEEPSAAEEESREKDSEKPAKEKRRKKEKKEKNKEKTEKKEKNREKKEGIGKRLAEFFFGSDDELEEENEKNSAQKKEAAEVKEKKKKEKKKKPEKKKEADPKKAAKEKQQKAKNAEKAQKKAEKAEKAEKERRAAKKLPKKKVIVWVLFCASIGAGILLLNSVGIATIQLTDARNAFEDKDFGTAYKLLNGRELSEDDQLIFSQSSAVLHLEHAEEAYENHLKLKKPVKALDDLLKGIAKYQSLLQIEGSELITPEVTAEYQNILNILQEQYSLSESGALEINAIDSDYEYSLQLEALVGGEVYQSAEEIRQLEEEEAANLPELEDMLPEEEEYLNGSSD